MNYRDEKKLQVAMKDVDDSLKMFDQTITKLENATKQYEEVNENIAREIELLKIRATDIDIRICSSKKVLANFKKLLNY